MVEARFQSCGSHCPPEPFASNQLSNIWSETSTVWTKCHLRHLPPISFLIYKGRHLQPETFASRQRLFLKSSNSATTPLPIWEEILGHLETWNAIFGGVPAKLELKKKIDGRQLSRLALGSRGKCFSIFEVKLMGANVSLGKCFP